MKKTLLTWVPLVALTAFTSCFKNKSEPVSGKNSSLKIEGMALNNLVGQGNVNLRGIAKFEFRVQNVDTPGAPLDTVSFADTFLLADPRGFDQNYDFDTPDKTKTFVFNLRILVDQGNAQSATLKGITYKRNGTTYLDAPGAFSGSGSLFVLNTQTVNF